MDIRQNTSDAQLWFSIYSLVVNYWRDVDYHEGRDAHRFYVADGAFVVGENHFDGHDGIRTFYTWRRKRERFGSRHLLSDLVVIADGERRARGLGVVTLHRAIGRPPYRTTSPALISDLTCDCVREDETWRFKSHVLDPLFVGDDVPLSLSVDTQHLATIKHATADDDRTIENFKAPRIG
jgi:SnoaL-like domain